MTLALRMHTIVLTNPGSLELIETPAPGRPDPGEALVRVHRIGICGTDLHAFRGVQPFFDYPRILGHELGVEIVEIGENHPALAPGDRCTVEPYLNCGRCGACLSGRTNCCDELRVLGVHTDGGMRPLIKVPVTKLHSSASLSLDQLALVEMLGIGAHAAERADPQPGESVLVIGAGPIGLSVIQFCALAGANVTVVDINPARLAFCRDHLGVPRCLPEPPVADPFTAVFDATGNPKSMVTAFDHVATGGRLIFVGLYLGRIDFDSAEFHRRELTLLATRNATPATFRRIIDLMEIGRIDPMPWITYRMTLTAVPQEFPGLLRQPGVVKAMVDLDRD